MVEKLLLKGSCVETLATCGFQHDEMDWAQTPEHIVQEEDELASRFVLLMREIVGQLGLSSLDCSHNLPHLFLVLLHPQPREQRKAADKIRGDVGGSAVHGETSSP